MPTSGVGTRFVGAWRGVPLDHEDTDWSIRRRRLPSVQSRRSRGVHARQQQRRAVGVPQLVGVCRSPSRRAAGRGDEDPRVQTLLALVRKSASPGSWSILFVRRPPIGRRARVSQLPGRLQTCAASGGRSP